MKSNAEKHMENITPENLEKFRNSTDAFITFASSYPTKRGLVRIGLSGDGCYCVSAKITFSKFTDPKTAIAAYSNLISE